MADYIVRGQDLFIIILGLFASLFLVHTGQASRAAIIKDNLESVQEFGYPIPIL